MNGPESSTHLRLGGGRGVERKEMKNEGAVNGVGGVAGGWATVWEETEEGLKKYELVYD